MGLFGRGIEHPLADSREVKRVLAELPVDQAVKAVDDLAGWFESLAQAEELRADRLYEVVSQLDQAGQVQMRRLTRDYLDAVRSGKANENALWAHGRFYWEQLAWQYERVAAVASQKDKVGEYVKALMPVIACRLAAALIGQIKWAHFRHERPAGELWTRLGRLYLEAVEKKYAGKVVTPYSATGGTSSVEQEYLRAALLATVSLDALRPHEVEIAERLITHLLPHFVIADQNVPGMLFWIDAASGEPTQRLAKLPYPSPTVRLLSPGAVADEIVELARATERGNVPEHIDLGGQYPARIVLKVLRHLASYWSSEPPLREHRRHPVKTRLTVTPGYSQLLAIATGGDIGAPQRWSSENVSLGGFGATVDKRDAGTVGIGSLVSVRPDGADSWLVGLVRRYAKEADGSARVGIQTLSRQASVGEFLPRTSGTYVAGASFKAIVLGDQVIGEEVHVVLPPTRFDLRENLDLRLGEQRYLLLPAECLESTLDFDYARYRVRPQ